jgi:uncharacterized protein YgiM (DUF1202 family)
MLTRASKWIILTLALSVSVSVLAQDNFCRRLIETALQATDQICSPTLRNQACYGHDTLQAQPQVGLDAFNFDSVGDIVEVSHIRSLRLSAMDLQNETWGVALMNLQANLPDEDPNQNIQLLLFGDVNVRNAIDMPREIDVTLQSIGNANVRRLPSDDSFVIGTLPRNASVTARGRSADNDWILVKIPDGESEGWVSSTLVKDYRQALSQLGEVEPVLSQYGPMQAFYVRTGNNSSNCEEAPNDGLLIQTPEGVAEVRLWINQVKIRLGSTVFIESNPGGSMTIKTLEGHASVEAMGVEYTAMAGTSVDVPMGDDEKPSAPPNPPKPIKAAEVENLPVDHLETPVVIELLPEETTSTTSDQPTQEVEPSVEASNTPARTEEAVSNTPVRTEEPTATDVPPTNEPPTARPTDEPTNEPPTDVPPTSEPPTSEPPTNEPPTNEPPTNEPPPSDDSGSSTGTSQNDPPTEETGA